MVLLTWFKGEFNLLPSSWNDFGVDVLIGVVIAMLFILANIIAPSFITLGLPTDYLTTQQGGFLVSTIGAPFAEELGFRGLLYGILTFAMPPEFAGLLQAVIFSLFHWQAYGLGLQSAFVGAFAFGVITWAVGRWRHSAISGIVLHIAFNLWLLGTKLAFIS